MKLESGLIIPSLKEVLLPWVLVAALASCATNEGRVESTAVDVASAAFISTKSSVSAQRVIQVVSLDGKAVSSAWNRRMKNPLVPGKHVLEVKYGKKQAAGVGQTRYIYSDPVAVTLNAQQGRTYRIESRFLEGKRWQPVVKVE